MYKYTFILQPHFISVEIQSAEIFLLHCITNNLAGHTRAHVFVWEKNTLCLTSVVDSGDGVSVEHAVEEGVGVFRELQDDKKTGIKYSDRKSVV